jgi:co-chaperonin GroES (HSP10)
MQQAEGWPYRPRSSYIFVADLGQPDRTKGGILLGDFDFGTYRFDMWRYGEVIAIGPGRLLSSGHREQMPSLNIGDVVIFSKKHGSRLPGEIRYQHPKYVSSEGLLVRVLDPTKTIAVVPSFDPWWAVADRQIDPSIHFSG